MATGTFKWYGKGFLSVFNKEIDWGSDTIKLALASSSYTPDQDTHDYFDDVTNEVTGTNWAAGGVTLGTPTISYNGTTNVIKLDANDVSVASVTLSGARNLIIYDASPGSAATNPLIAYATLDADLSPSAGTLAISFASTGILTITPA